jgi:hypothetical protein
MLHRIVVDVIAVSLEITLVEDRMLPESALPDAAFLLEFCVRPVNPTFKAVRRYAIMSGAPS